GRARLDGWAGAPPAGTGWCGAALARAQGMEARPMRAVGCRRSRRYHWRVGWLGSLLLAALCWPRWVYAGSCNGDLVPDISACLDATNYNAWKGLAVLGWNLNRLLLIGAYQLDQWRWWLTQNVFLSVYTAIVAFVGPLVAPVATLAMTLAVLGVLLL